MQLTTGNWNCGKQNCGWWGWGGTTVRSSSFVSFWLCLGFIFPLRPHGELILWQPYLYLDLLWVNTDQVHGPNDPWVPGSCFWILMAPLPARLWASGQAVRHLYVTPHVLPFSPSHGISHFLSYLSFLPAHHISTCTLVICIHLLFLLDSKFLSDGSLFLTSLCLTDTPRSVE